MKNGYERLAEIDKQLEQVQKICDSLSEIRRPASMDPEMWKQVIDATKEFAVSGHSLRTAIIVAVHLSRIDLVQSLLDTDADDDDDDDVEDDDEDDGGNLDDPPFTDNGGGGVGFRNFIVEHLE